MTALRFLLTVSIDLGDDVEDAEQLADLRASLWDGLGSVEAEAAIAEAVADSCGYIVEAVVEEVAEAKRVRGLVRAGR